MSIGHLLNKTVEVWRLARAKDGQGGWIERHYLHHGEPLRISPAGAQERLIAAQEDVRLTHIGYGLANANLRRGDELRVDGRTLTVLGGRPPSKPHHTKWWLEEFQVAESDAALALPGGHGDDDVFGEPGIQEA